MMAGVSFASAWIARVSSRRSSWVVIRWGCVAGVASLRFYIFMLASRCQVSIPRPSIDAAICGQRTGKGGIMLACACL